MLIQKFDSIIRDKVSTPNMQEIDGIDDAALECVSLTKKIAVAYSQWFSQKSNTSIEKIMKEQNMESMSYEDLYDYWLKNLSKYGE